MKKSLKNRVPDPLFDKESFFERVYDVVRQIPAGRVTSYGAIAKFLGTGRSSRMVGYAMNGSHGAFPEVPAHRVVNRNGLLTGKMHFATHTAMEDALRAEGISVINDQIINFSAVYWDPAKELQ